MNFLYEQLETLRDSGFINEMPHYIKENLNPSFELRPYQVAAFENFITLFENNKLREKLKQEQEIPQLQTLFHMATGSGKTLIMAGLILYLYKKGYRNFLFFVNLNNIVNKTKDNFLNSKSSKYLFADEICINGERIAIRQVENFHQSDEDSINICFKSTGGLHQEILTPHENRMSEDDFEGRKVVLISDESHHLNVDTKKIKPGSDEELEYQSWEQTIKGRLLPKNKDNILLEFTATCDLNNQNIKAKYINKIIFDYPLSKFREDGFSKEIKTMRTDVPMMERALQAVILSQYRLKVFQDNRLSIKPVILFKSQFENPGIKHNYTSNDFKRDFIKKISELTGAELQRISELTDNETLREVYAYFKKKGISWDQLAQELKEDFSAEHCISASDKAETEGGQLVLNSLEDKDNPYRAVFECQRLDEGWDVLNLFDIVRLYETRQSGGKKISSYTLSEAQLIGRGARYCPFAISDEQEKYKRKYDNDINNPLRKCEELYYHCQNDSRYIGELNNALREIGMDVENAVVCEYVFKESFKADPLYKTGFVFKNEKIKKDPKEIKDLSEKVRVKEYKYRANSGSSGEDTVFNSGESTDSSVETYTYITTIAEIAAINYAIVHRAICKYPVLKFSNLLRCFPNLKSTREFITSENYLGGIRININSTLETPTPDILYSACVNALSEISEYISKNEQEEKYCGSKEFKPFYIHEIFEDHQECHYNCPVVGSIGYSQNDSTVFKDWRIDLSKEDWFAFEDNFGTSEEKAFIAYFKQFVPQLKQKYNKVFLLRNEKRLKIYPFFDFSGGNAFEPDFILFLHTVKGMGYEQLQVFIEPKGEVYIGNDIWKENFLLEIEKEGIPVKTFVDDNDYRIWGFHFFNQTERKTEFNEDFERLLN